MGNLISNFTPLTSTFKYKYISIYSYLIYRLFVEKIIIKWRCKFVQFGGDINLYFHFLLFKGLYFLYKINVFYFEFYYFDSLINFFDKNFITKNLIKIKITKNIKINIKILRIIKHPLI